MHAAQNKLGEHHEWALRPSFQQVRLDAAALSTGSCLLFLLLPFTWWLSLLLAALGALLSWQFARQVRTPVDRFGCNASGWWIMVRGERQAVRWRSGSIRRYELVRLQWGFWPWQHILVRADSLANSEDFRRLRQVLYAQL